MKIGVLGGYGFLGSHLVDELVEAGEEVLVLDDRTSCWMNAELDEPAFRNEGARPAELRELVDCEVLVNLALRHPLERELATYRMGFDGYVSGFADLVFSGVRARTLRRVVVAGTLEALEPLARSPAAHLVRAAREVLGYLHRPPRFDVEFVHLPELYGPRQLPEAGWVAALLNEAVLTHEERYVNLAYVLDAARLLRERALERHHRAGVDLAVGAPAVVADDVLAALGALDDALGPELRAELERRAVGLSRGVASFPGGVYLSLGPTPLEKGLIETIRFYEEVEREL
jgi:nucleoside-diphosphate-sugar epimerase